MTKQLSSEARRPFLSAPDPARYVATGPIEEARQRITRCIARDEGAAIVVGGAGLGKSLAVALLARTFAPQRTVATIVGSQLCTRRALLQAISAELGLPYRGLDEAELRLALLESIRGGSGQPRRILLLVDEAESLPPRLLEELRLLTNVSRHGLPLVNLVLAGGPALEERLAEPLLESLSQRIAARCYLAPLRRDETLQYVRAQAAAAGLAAEKLFEAGALDAIHAATGGVPRLINQLGDQLMWMGEETGCMPLDATLVQQAWSDLQQLPAPWDADAHSSDDLSSVGVVEFGELDADEAHEFVSGIPLSGGGVRSGRRDALHEDAAPSSIPIDAARRLPDRGQLAEFDAQLDAAEDLVAKFDDVPPAAPQRGLADDLALPLRAADPFADSFDEEETLADDYAGFGPLRSPWPRNLAPAPGIAWPTAPHSPAAPATTPAVPAELNFADENVTPALNFTTGATVLLSVAADPAPGGEDPRAIASRQAEERSQDFQRLLQMRQSASTAVAETALEEGVLADADDAPEIWTTVPITAAAKAPSREVLVVDEDESSPTTAVVPGRQLRRLFSQLESGSPRSRLG